MIRNRFLPTSFLAAIALLGLSLVPILASAGVVFSESFETPVVSGFAGNTVPSGGKWIGATLGFGSTNRGLYNEPVVWPATPAFTTPFGNQAYDLNYTNSGLTTAVGATGQTLMAGVTYKVSFNAAVAVGTATGTPVTGGLFVFYITDTDSEGFPDTYELANTTPPSNTALNPGDDLDTDGLTNLQEYQYGTNPNDSDSDNDTPLDGPEITGAGVRPATNPLLADSDGLSDGVETNTGVWVSASNTGTNPTDADKDNDGLKDGVETKTGTFVSKIDTRTDPYLADTDNDGAGDWHEVTASYTNPNSNTSKPNLPYPLPDRDGSTGATNKPVKVYIMSGQSNMVGIGYVGGGAGSLDTITKLENKCRFITIAVKRDGCGSLRVSVGEDAKPTPKTR